jgi:hypothetical protein
MGRFFFRPSATGVSLYAAHSEFAYTFGAYAFGDESVCQVALSNAAGTGPGMTLSSGASECTVSGSVVTVKLAASSIDFFVVVNRAAKWTNDATAAGEITATLKNYNTQVQATNNATGKKMKLPTATALATSTATGLVLSKTMHNTMDTGDLVFKVTPKTTGFVCDATCRIAIDVPSYYKPNLGEFLTCSYWDMAGKAMVEALYCEMGWDYHLNVWGPASKKIDQNVTASFLLKVHGVQMNDAASAGKLFQLSMTNGTTLTDPKKAYDASTNAYLLMTELGTIVDTVGGTWKATNAIELKSVSSSASTVRAAATTLTVVFKVPTTATTVMKAADYVTLELPFNWGMVATMMDGSAKLTGSIKSDQVPAKTYKAPTVTYSTNCVLVKLATNESMVENATYTITVGGVPTPMNVAAFPGSFVVSVGKSATGGTGWSASSLMSTAAPTFAIEANLALLKFSSALVDVNQGQFSGAVCV